MLRTQTVRPTLCKFACTVEQTWDSATGLVVSATLLAHCSRHAGLSDADATTAITAESQLWNGTIAAGVTTGVSLVNASGAINPTTGNLEVTVTGITTANRLTLTAKLPAKVILL